MKSICLLSILVSSLTYEGTRATRLEMLTAANENGFRDLASDAVRHVLAGTTSLSEISRVVDLTARAG